MPGLSDYSAKASLNWEAGISAMPALAARWLALFTTVPSDAGAGGTEVSGSGYGRVQVAGTLAAGASFTTSSTTITLGSTAPAWLLALGTNGSGCSVQDTTTGTAVGFVSSITGTTVTLTTTSSINSSGSTDSLVFSAFPPATASSGAEPATAAAQSVNGAGISFGVSSGSWGTVVGWGLYDASTSGNLIRFDYLGAFDYRPFTCTTASPGVLTSTAHGFSNADNVVVTAKYDGSALPATGGSWAGLLTVANVTTDTFTAGVNTTGTGAGMVRKVASQAVGTGSTVGFASSTLTLLAA